MKELKHTQTGSEMMKSPLLQPSRYENRTLALQDRNPRLQNSLQHK